MTAQLVKALVSLVKRERKKIFLIYLPRNFFGGLIGSPASGQTTHLSSTKLKIYIIRLNYTELYNPMTLYVCIYLDSIIFFYSNLLTRAMYGQGNPIR